MSEDGEKPIIIVNKKGHAGHGHHGGSWKVAIADLMTAMMALFMVLWLIGQSPKTRATVGAYFRDPMGLAGGGNTETTTGPMSGGASFFSGGNTPVNQEMGFAPGRIDNQQSSSASGRDALELSRARDRLAQALLSLRLDTWSRHVELTAIEEGLRIEIQDDKTESLFPPGSTRVNAEAKKVLSLIAQEVGILPNRVVIEGHTDVSKNNRRRNSGSNWEISTKRANAARRFLINNGMRYDQVAEVRGYASERLRLWHDPSSPRNRRISILVLLERGSKSKAQTPGKPHPLLEKLRNLDFATKSLENRSEISPSGAPLPPVPDGPVDESSPLEQLLPQGEPKAEKPAEAPAKEQDEGSDGPPAAGH